MNGEGAAASPFPPRVVLALVVVGVAAFFALLWLIGSGMSYRESNDGGSHAAARGLTGYAAFAQYLGKRDWTVNLVRSRGALTQPGVLVLTPPATTDTKQLANVVERRRLAGPTVVVVPKWFAYRAPPLRREARAGWVELGGPQPAEWDGFYDDLSLSLDKSRTRQARTGWVSGDLHGTLPDPSAVLSGRGKRLVPLVEARDDGRVLAGYIADGGDYPGLRALSTAAEPDTGEDEADSDVRYPVVFVFEPDLIDNYGLANFDNARLGERILTAALNGEERKVSFDLTFNGFGRSRSLLTLAFEPPFLAATLCLMLAVLVLAWRGFNRFGPALRGGRALAFGKAGLVANAAGLIRRTGRLHLIGAPYADAARDRLSRVLALPLRLDAAQSEAAIDRALAARAPDLPAFTATAAALRGARRPIDVLRAARTLHSLERTLTR